MTIISGVAGWRLFSAAHDGLPTRPSFQSGGLLVFVDHPNVHANIIVNIDRSGLFSISVLSKSGGKFLVVASGSAKVYTTSILDSVAPEFISGPAIKTVEEDGCLINGKPCIASARNDSSTDFEVADFDYTLNNYSSSSVTVAGGNVYFGNGYPGAHRLEVYGKLSNRIVASSGSTELGQLPIIGTSDSMSGSWGAMWGQSSLGYLTFSGNISKAFEMPESENVRSGSRWYPPKANVHVSVMYSGSAPTAPPQANASGLLPPNYTLVSADPPTETSGALRWQGSQSLDPSWNLSDSSAEQSHNVLLFLSGVLLGAAVSFAGIAIDRMITPK